jgi:hypothetical protein
VASIAAASNGAFTEAEIRVLNGLPAGAEPAVGVVLRIPGPVDPGGAVSATSGTVTVSIAGSGDRPAVEGEALPTGSTVCTGPASYATLRVGTDLATRAHDEVSMLGGTCVRLDDGTAATGRRASLLSVDRGSISIRNADKDPGTVTVLNRNGVTTSIGGGFRVTVEEAATRTEALDHGLSVELWYADADGDGYGDPAASATVCDPPEGYVADDSDCDDTEATAHPGGTEIADDGIDQDCDGADASSGDDTGGGKDEGCSGCAEAPAGPGFGVVLAAALWGASRRR